MASSEPDTRTRILAAAEAEFLAHGYDGARMQAIADRAAINKAMVHYHFRSKEELFAQIVKGKAELLFPKVQADMRAQTDFIAFTCRFIDSYLALLRANPFLPHFLLQVSARRFDLLQEVGIEFPKKYVAAFEAAAKRGEIRTHDARQFLMAIFGMCVMPFVGKNLFKGFLGIDDSDYQALLAARAEEVKRYVVLLLTPESTHHEDT